MPIERICQQCGETFTSNHVTRVRKYCSKQCVSNATRDRTKRICPICGKVFHRSLSSKAKTCSADCGYKLLSRNNTGEKHWNWQGKRRTYHCEICGKEIVSILHPRTGWKRFCSRKCKGIAHAPLVEREKSGRWEGGKSFEPYPTGFNPSIKREIRKRDNYTCQLCEIPESKLAEHLSIHHVDYNKDNLSLDNLISLCRSCNSKVNHNRDKWIKHLKPMTTAR